MFASELDRRASLTVWPATGVGGAVPSREFETLREAIRAATATLGQGGARPWIVTESGDILSPNWIRAHADTLP